MKIGQKDVMRKIHEKKKSFSQTGTDYLPGWLIEDVTFLN